MTAISTILVCGSRTWDEDDMMVDQVLYGIWKSWDEPVRIIHGDARGADTAAAEWAGVEQQECQAFPADWAQYGKRAGYLRNAQMLSEGKPDMVLAFVDKPLAESKGTAMMVDLATKAGVPTYVIQRVGNGRKDTP